VGRGLAIVLRTPATGDIEVGLIDAQRTAMRHKIGLWQTLPDIKGPLIGNRNSWRFHLETCPYGRKTRHRNRVVLKDLRQAYWKGYAPCSRCFPPQSRRHPSSPKK
jgi:micrococcal nuclease